MGSYESILKHFEGWARPTVHSAAAGAAVTRNGVSDGYTKLRPAVQNTAYCIFAICLPSTIVAENLIFRLRVYGWQRYVKVPMLGSGNVSKSPDL